MMKLLFRYWKALLILVILGLVVYFGASFVKGLYNKNKVLEKAIKQYEEQIKMKEEENKKLEEMLQNLQEEQYKKEKRIKAYKQTRKELKEPISTDEILKRLKALGYEVKIR